MNKKFLSVILFSTLMIGTAGTFTSCKDYDDDIDGLENRVSAVEKLVGDLQQTIDKGAVVTGVEKNDNGIVIKLSNGESYPVTNGANGHSPVIKIGDNGNWFIDDVDTGKPSKGEGTSGVSAPTIYFYPGTEATGKEHGLAENGYWVKVTIEPGKDAKYEVQTTKWLPEGTLTAVWNTEDQTLTLGNMKDENGKLVSKTISLSTKLRSLVFVPDLYEDGVEATKYAYAPGLYMQETKATAAISGSDWYGASYSILKDNKISWAANVKASYLLNPIATVNYHLNPLNAKVDNVAWKFLATTPEYVNTRAAVPVVTPVFLKATKADGKLAVDYQLKQDDLKKGNLSIPGVDGYISVAALEGTLANEEGTVTSDYAAIMPVVQNLKAIAYNTLTTNEADNELYKTAKDAIENMATVPVLYNGGAIELNNYLNIHYIEKYLENPVGDEAHKVLKYADAVSKYGLKFQYEPVHYTSGDNKTEENAYSKLTADGKFTPCYVDSKGETVEIPEGNTDATGKSAVGRRPVVLVKLVDTNNNNAVVLAGYIRLDIVSQVGFKGIVIDKSVPQLPYLCPGFEQGITWADMSGKVLEELKLTKDEFQRDFYFTNGQYAEGKDAEGNLKYVINTKYGKLVEKTDAWATSTNPILTWEANFTEMAQLYKDFKDHTLTLYARYQSYKDVNYSVYVGIKVTVADMPTTSGYGEKRDAYWYPKTTALASRDTVRTNVPHPDATNNVMGYNKNLDDYFVTSKNVSGIDFYVSDASKAVYGGIWNKLGIQYIYKFAASQYKEKIGGKVLSASTDGTQLKWGNDVIAEITGGRTITYKTSGPAQTFLNLYGHAEAKPNQQFANIEIQATYGDCKLALEKPYYFNARFLRPLDIQSNDKAQFVDAEANGSSILLGSLFKANDWRDKAVIIYNTTTKKYEAAVENSVNLYKYYEVEQVTLDLSKATCDIDKIGTQKAIDPQVIKLTVLDKVGGAEISEVIDITNIDKLNEVVLNYKNNKGNTSDFTIMIPVNVKYAWGVVSDMVAITVKGTIANR